MSIAGGYLTYYRDTLNSRGVGPGAFFRRILDRQARALGQRDRYALFLPRVLSLCNLADEPTLTVLEVGAGNGWALHFERSGLTRIALDQSSEFAEEMVALGIELQVCDVSRQPMPFIDEGIDLIMMNHVIEHIVNVDWLVGECRRVLRPGGVLYVRTPNIRRVRDAFWEDYTHVRPFTPNSLRAVARAHGLIEMFTLYSDHTRINLDILTSGQLRPLLFGRRTGGAEIEAAFRKRRAGEA